MRKLAALIGLVLLVAVGWGIWWKLQNRLFVRNESGQRIRMATIKVGPTNIRFDDIEPGESRSERFSTGGKASFEFHAEMADGTKIDQESLGYVSSSEFAERAEFVILPHGKMKFKQSWQPEFNEFPRKTPP